MTSNGSTFLSFCCGILISAIEQSETYGMAPEKI